MGFFGFLRKGIGAVGNVLKRVGQFAAPVIRKVGEYAVPIGIGSSLLAEATGHPKLSQVLGGVAMGADLANRYAPKIARTVERVGDYGDELQRKYRSGD